MSPRNPEEMSGVDLQNKTLRDVHEVADSATHVAPDPEARSTPPLAPRPEEPADAKTVPDRVEAYLKGPTVFSA